VNAGDPTGLVTNAEMNSWMASTPVTYWTPSGGYTSSFSAYSGAFSASRSAPTPVSGGGSGSSSSETKRTVSSPSQQTDPRGSCYAIQMPVPTGASLRNNIRATQIFLAANDALSTLGWWGGHVISDWNYKSPPEGAKYGPFGNFNMGATGAVFLALQDILHMNTFFGGASNGRNPFDNGPEVKDCSEFFIAAGYNYYQQGSF